jgi:hypothetical protein
VKRGLPGLFRGRSRGLLRAVTIPALLGAFFGCGGSNGSPASGVPSGWMEIRVGTLFTLMAPPGTVWHPAKGKDSAAGTVDAPGFSLSYDYGLYANPLDNSEGDRNYAAQDAVFDGHKARIVTADAPRLSAERPYFIGVHFPELKKSAVGSVSLTVQTSVAKKSDYEMVSKIFGSMRID